MNQYLEMEQKEIDEQKRGIEYKKIPGLFGMMERIGIWRNPQGFLFRGFLFQGPEGCRKRFFAEVTACLLNWNFFEAKLTSPNPATSFGETITAAESGRPSLICIDLDYLDEMDQAPREQIVTTLNRAMNPLHSGEGMREVYFVGLTNNEKQFENPSILKCFQKLRVNVVDFCLPSAEMRREILRDGTCEFPDCAKEDVGLIEDWSDQFSYRNLEQVVVKVRKSPAHSLVAAIQEVNEERDGAKQKALARKTYIEDTARDHPERRDTDFAADFEVAHGCRPLRREVRYFRQCVSKNRREGGSTVVSIVSAVYTPPPVIAPLYYSTRPASPFGSQSRAASPAGKVIPPLCDSTRPASPFGSQSRPASPAGKLCVPPGTGADCRLTPFDARKRVGDGRRGGEGERGYCKDGGGGGLEEKKGEKRKLPVIGQLKQKEKNDTKEEADIYRAVQQSLMDAADDKERKKKETTALNHALQQSIIDAAIDSERKMRDDAELASGMQQSLDAMP